MCSIYHPPSSSELYLTELCHQLKLIRNKYSNSAFWIGGDINLPDIDWSTNSIQNHHYTLSLNNIFLDFSYTNALIQMVDVSTRGANILDIFVTNRPCVVEECNTIARISDHEAVLITSAVIAQLHHPPKRYNIYLWAQADFNLIRQCIESLYEEFTTTYTSTTPVDFLWDEFLQSVTSAWIWFPPNLLLLNSVNHGLLIT